MTTVENAEMRSATIRTSRWNYLSLTMIESLSYRFRNVRAIVHGRRPAFAAKDREPQEAYVMSRTGKAIGAVIAALMLALMPGLAHAEDTAQSIYQAAKKEGKVVLWTAIDVSLQKKVAAKFNEKYPGITVEAFKIFPGPAIERLITETKNGQHNVDIIDPNVAFLPQLFSRDLVESYPYDKVLGVDPERLLFDKRGIVIGHYDLPISYNTNLVKPGDIKSWDDLLDPKYQGKVLVEAHAYALGILGTKWGEEKMLAYIKRLVANKPIIINSPTATAEALSAGQGAVAIGAYAARISLYKDAGAPIDWARVGPIPAQQVVSVPIKGGPHPNAAKLYAAFWATEDAQKIFYDVYRHGIAIGKGATPRGQEIQRLGLEVVLEPTDIERSKRLLEVAGRALGSIK
jgi:iron(III) transport system substrate-binding protein